MASPNKEKLSLSEFEPKKEEKKEGGGFDVGQAMNMASSFMYKSPAKNMKTGKYKHSFEGGTPYKMRGHELPGPNQYKSPTKFGILAARAALGMDTAQAGGVGQAFGKRKKVRVAPHGDESHTAAGGAGDETLMGEQSQEVEAPWEAMGRKDLMGMDKGDRKEYMGGLSKSQRKQQMKAMLPFGGGGSGGGGGITSSIGGIFSDIRLKEKIERTGKSPSGIPTYEFNYIGDNNRYSGAMAQDLLEMNIDAVSMGDDGFYRVNYNNIDVDMRLIN